MQEFTTPYIPTKQLLRCTSQPCVATLSFPHVDYNRLQRVCHCHVKLGGFGGGGGQHIREQICILVQLASWNVVVLSSTHFECCIVEKYKQIKNENFGQGVNVLRFKNMIILRPQMKVNFHILEQRGNQVPLLELQLSHTIVLATKL